MSLTSPSRTAVLLDQHPLWLDAVEQVLNRVGDVVVVGKTSFPDVALELIEEHEPDVFVTAMELPSIDGITLLERAQALAPAMKAVAVSASDDPELVGAALAAGADAFVVKTAHPDDLASAIRQSFEHSVYFALQPRPAAARPRLVEAADTAGLTRRELEILRLMAEGLSNAQLARMLWVTEQTVKFHLSNIYRKLDVANRTEASRWAQLHGLLSAERTPAAVSNVA
jgi:NarL family two-component system response regulator LiaR